MIPRSMNAQLHRVYPLPAHSPASSCPRHVRLVGGSGQALLTSGEALDSLPAESKDRSQPGFICLPDDCCFSSCTCSSSPLAVTLSEQTPQQNMHVMHSRLRLLATLIPRSVNTSIPCRNMATLYTGRAESTFLVYIVPLRNITWS